MVQFRSCLESKEQSDGLQAVLASINIVPQEQIVNITDTKVIIAVSTLVPRGESVIIFNTC